MELSEFKQHGETLMKTLRGLKPDLDYDDASLEWIDDYFNRNREIFTDDNRRGVSVALGYLLGETIIREVIGDWQYDDQREVWFVDLGDLGQANPISKAEKHLKEPFDSIYSMLRVTRMVVEKGGWDALQNAQAENKHSGEKTDPNSASESSDDATGN